MFQHLFLIALVFPLEWNSTYRTDVPYEVDVNPAKLGAEVFTVFADGKPLATERFKGKLPGNVTLRFSVPEGVKGLRVKGMSTDGDVRCPSARSTDGDVRCPSKPATNHQPLTTDPFSEALKPVNICRWKLGKGMTMAAGEGGLVVTARQPSEKKPRGATDVATYTVDLPPDWAGKPVVQEISVENMAKLVLGGRCCIEQLDEKGDVLPESVADVRWTSHMRPPNKLMEYRDEGHIHLKARKLRFYVSVANGSAEFDAYGYPIKDPSMTRGKLAIRRLSVRVAEQLPFPKWNDRFFGEGVSGVPGDTSFKLGGALHQGLFYQATSRAGWTQKFEFKNDSWRTFPAQGGTVEAWFRRTGDAAKPLPLFEANQSYSAATHFRGRGSVLRVDYRVADKTFLVGLIDTKGKTFSGEAKGVDLPEGVWMHVALQWQPGGKAELFVGGRKRCEMALDGFVAPDPANRKIKDFNDEWATEFYFGTDFKTARNSDEGRGLYFEGEGDELRVSSVPRYTGDFKPVKKPAVDEKTCAYFSFDRRFDGVMGTGFGFIPASVRADEDRVEHVLKVSTDEDVRCPSGDGRSNRPHFSSLQYYPEEILPENDPEVVFNTLNYPVLPSDADFAFAKTTKTKTFKVKTGDRVSVKAGEKAYPLYTEFRNISESEPLVYPILVAEGRLDPRSFGDLADSLGLDKLTDREKVNRVFQYMLSASDYYANHQLHYAPDSNDPKQATYQAMVVLNSYCGFECGPLNNMTANMMATVAGCAAGVTGGYGHEFEQVFFDGKNHIYDLSAQKFFPAFDNETSAYLKEMGDQPGLKQRRFKYPDHFIRKGSRGCWVNGVGYCEKFAMTVNPGERLRILYSNRARANNLQSKARGGLYGGDLQPWEWDYGSVQGGDNAKTWVARKDRIFNHRSAAVLSFDGRPTAKNPAFAASGDGFVYRVKSCYPVTYGEYAAYLKDGRTAALELSTDGGKTYRPLKPDGDGVVRSEYLVKARTGYFIRVKAPMSAVTRFTALTEGEVNPRTYPGWVMKGGATAFQFKAEPNSKAEVTVAWQEPAKAIVVEKTAKWGTIPGCEHEIVQVDPAKPLALKVSGAGTEAKAVAKGALSAKLENGVLTLAYDPKKRRALPRGSDDPEPRDEFPQFAAVDIVDGSAVKTVAVLVSPDARLAVVQPTEIADKKVSVKIDEIPAGKYAVFALGRFDIDPQGVVGFVYAGPFAGKRPKDRKSLYACRARNVTDEYLKAKFGQGKGRARWKWGMIVEGHGLKISSNSGSDYAVLDLPKTDHVDFALPWKNREDEKVEIGAVLLVPNPGRDFVFEARQFLFGYNCDPFQSL